LAQVVALLVGRVEFEFRRQFHVPILAQNALYRQLVEKGVSAFLYCD
jgi:hypothetical protein